MNIKCILLLILTLTITTVRAESALLSFNESEVQSLFEPLNDLEHTIKSVNLEVNVDIELNQISAKYSIHLENNNMSNALVNQMAINKFWMGVIIGVAAYTLLALGYWILFEYWW
jgi:hypothetical protein